MCARDTTNARTQFESLEIMQHQPTTKKRQNSQALLCLQHFFCLTSQSNASNNIFFLSSLLLFDVYTRLSISKLSTHTGYTIKTRSPEHPFLLLLLFGRSLFFRFRIDTTSTIFKKKSSHVENTNSNPLCDSDFFYRPRLCRPSHIHKSNYKF